MGVMTAHLWGICPIPQVFHEANHVAIIEKTDKEVLVKVWRDQNPHPLLVGI